MGGESSICQRKAGLPLSANLADDADAWPLLATSLRDLTFEVTRMLNFYTEMR